MDLICDSVATGRRINYLTASDDFRPWWRGHGRGPGISGEYFTPILDVAAIFHRLPRTSRFSQVGHIHGYINSFNSKFSHECLSEQWFQTLHPAHSAITVWPQDYCTVRSHKSSGHIARIRIAERPFKSVGEDARL